MLRWAPHDRTIQRALKNGVLVSAWAQRMRDAVCAMRACGALAEATPAMPAAAVAELALLRDVADHALELCRAMEAAPSAQPTPPAEFEPATCQLTEQVREVARLVSGLVSPTVRLRLSLDDHPMTTSVRSSDAQHVLLTLLLHARDVVAEGGCIDLRLWPEAKTAPGHAHVRLSVGPLRPEASARRDIAEEPWWQDLRGEASAWGGLLHLGGPDTRAGRVWHLHVPLVG